MGGANENPSSRYTRLGWDELPPQRTRFYFWLFLFFLLGPLGRIPLEMAGASSFLAAMTILGLTVVILIPLGWLAWQELRQRRANGEDLPPATVKGAVVVAWAVTSLLFWGAVALVPAESRDPLIPLLPMFCTLITCRRFLQWRRQRVGSAN